MQMTSLIKNISISSAEFQSVHVVQKKTKKDPPANGILLTNSAAFHLYKI